MELVSADGSYQNVGNTAQSFRHVCRYFHQDSRQHNNRTLDIICWVQFGVLVMMGIAYT